MIGWLTALVLAPLLIVGLGAAWAGRLALALVGGHWLGVVGLGVLLGLVYLATVGVSAADGAVALGIGVALALVERRGRARVALRGLPRRMARTPALIGAALRETAKGTVLMTKVVFNVRSWRRAGLVDVPLDGRSEAGITLTGLIVTVAPGTMLVEVDRSTGRMLIHSMDASDPAEVRASIVELYRRYQKPVVP